MTKEKPVVTFRRHLKTTDGLYIYTENGEYSFFIHPEDDGTVKTMLANNSIEECNRKTFSSDTIALSVSSEENGLYKVIFVGNTNLRTEKFEYTFILTKKVKDQLEDYLSNLPAYIVNINSSMYQCVYKGIKLKVEYPKPQSGFEELVQASIFGAMKEHLCNYEKWFNYPYLRDPIHFGSRINPNTTILDNGDYLLNGKKYDKNGKEIREDV